MSNENSTKNLPTHRMYSVSKNGDEKATWTEIGAAFEHKDRKGFNLVFTARPLEGAQVVLRTAKARKAGVNSPRGTAGRHDDLNAGGGAH